ncbi:MAG: methyltransferase domain-containing protein [Dinghuibacter sp.]|nr:methyltransferase domain-containing protein [Dinghuibacter sp.]
MSDFEKKYYESDEFWGKGMVSDGANMTRLHHTVALIPTDAHSLADIGCGNGLLGKLVMEKRSGITIMSVDRSEQALSYVQTEKKIGDVTNIPLPDAAYDCVSCLQVLEHIPVNNYKTALAELARVSKKYILVSVPFNERIEKNTTQCPGCKTIFNVDLHLRSYTETDIKNLFTEQGFELKEFLNVVESNELLGLRTYHKLKNRLTGKKPVFNSPICPLCGYENNQFAIIPEGGALAQVATAPQAGLKGFLKKIWPQRKVPGYWVIALYCKK